MSPPFDKKQVYIFLFRLQGARKLTGSQCFDDVVVVDFNRKERLASVGKIGSGVAHL